MYVIFHKPSLSFSDYGDYSGKPEIWYGYAMKLSNRSMNDSQRKRRRGSALKYPKGSSTRVTSGGTRRCVGMTLPLDRSVASA